MNRSRVRLVVVPALLALALSGCASESAEPEADPSISESAPAPVSTPTPTVTTRAIDEESYKFGVPKEEAGRLFAIDAVSYESVPIEERAQYVLYYADQSEFVANAESYADFTLALNGTDFDRLPASLDPTNSAQEILAFVTALDRLTFSVPDADNSDLFDQDVAFRLISSEVVTGKTSAHAGKLVNNLSQLVDYDGGEVRDNDSLEINSLLATPEVQSASNVAENAQGRPSIDITYTTSQGNTITETYQWVTVGGAGVWLPN